MQATQWYCNHALFLQYLLDWAPRCITKICREDYCPVTFPHQGYLAFVTLFLGCLNITVLSALLPSLVSTFLL